MDGPPGARNLAEHGQADRIYVSSRYAWESFVEEGFAEDHVVLPADARSPSARPEPAASGPTAVRSATFDVVCRRRADRR